MIPLWKGKSGVEPLDDRNPWREAWQALNTAGSAVPVTVIRGDQLDQSAVSAEEAYVGDVSALSRLNERYRAPTIIVAVVEGDKDSGPFTVGGLRYDTQTGARKPATTESGLVVQVPIFVNEGDTIRVDTRTGEYQTRV